ncbi:toprim domain-containing protein [Sulfitobacter sp. W002]|uniref:toprim domain-containing protein n=1 Tax=Sulfitobacter sp. W002 TaxID=2867024 RepID=UPI0021A2C80F|nr:toprim domain-containing protein [Sulfitobacter sp. W002]UWR30906.1 toprim domain-containing protein [Sulfitobacter sp. W002]
MAMRTEEQNKAELNYFKQQDIKVALTAFGYKEEKAHYNPEDGKSHSTSWKSGGTTLKIYPSKKTSDWMWECTSGPSPSESGNRSGTIIHIASKIEGSLGRARMKLRDIYGDPFGPHNSTLSPSSSAPSSSHSPPFEPPADKKTYGEIGNELKEEADRWEGDTEVPIYLRERGLEDLDPMFARSFWFAKNAHKGSPNVIFPYYAKHPETGNWCVGCFERKNRNFKGVAARAPSSGFWRCGTTSGRASWYVAENPINAMSWNKVQRDAGMPLDGINYVGLRSGGDKILVEHIKELCAKGQAPLEIVFLADNDPRGWRYAADVGDSLKAEIDTHGILVRMELAPGGHNDWNDYLMDSMGLTRTPPEATPEPEVSYKVEDLDDIIPF